jgi:hypothetical protein
LPFRWTIALPEPTVTGVGDRASAGDGTYTVDSSTTLLAEICAPVTTRCASPSWNLRYLADPASHAQSTATPSIATAKVASAVLLDGGV